MRASESDHWAIIAYGMVSIWLTKGKGGRQSAEWKKSASQGEADFLQMPAFQEERLLAILLNPGGPQPCEAVLIDGKLPGQEFVDGQRVTAASFLEREQTPANRGNNFGLATDNPPLGSGCGQIRNRQRTTVRPDDVFYPRAMGLCHGVLTNSRPLN
jgi:hypothetical protein